MESRLSAHIAGFRASIIMYPLHKTRQTAVPIILGKSPLFPLKMTSLKTVWSQSVRQRYRCVETLMRWGNDVVRHSATGRTCTQAGTPWGTHADGLLLACFPLPYDCFWVLVVVFRCFIDQENITDSFEYCFIANSECLGCLGCLCVRLCFLH